MSGEVLIHISHEDGYQTTYVEDSMFAAQRKINEYMGNVGDVVQIVLTIMGDDDDD